jgi:hypothetical protein
MNSDSRAITDDRARTSESIRRQRHDIERTHLLAHRRRILNSSTTSAVILRRSSAMSDS